MVALFLASSSSPEALWTAAFEEVCERIGPCFARSETRERAAGPFSGAPIKLSLVAVTTNVASPLVLSYHCSIRQRQSGPCATRTPPK
jgi:hypothetical protein